ncbi:MAG: flippase-like domain-containing protein [Anaerolineae bacterium]|nr:flippase-like domain-containing protein [Anaerolineae bacterium]
MEDEKKGSKQLWVGILVSVICLAAIFFFIEPSQIWEALKSANYWYLLLTALGITLFLVIRAWRWRFMLENEVAIMPTFHIQNIGYLVNTFLPLRLGDITQAVLIGSVPPVTIARGLSTVVMARILDMMFIVVLLPLTVSQVDFLPESVQSAALATGIVTMFAILVLIIAANQRPFITKVTTAVFSRIHRLNTEAWVRRVDDLLVGLSSLTHLKSGFILIGLTILTWIPILGAYYFGMVAVHLSPTLPMAGFVMCAAAFSVAAPSSPGQVGVFHAGVIFALVNILGQPEAESASFAFLYHAINLIVMTVWGIIGLLATGATFQHVIDSTRQYLNKKDDKINKELSHPTDLGV